MRIWKTKAAAHPSAWRRAYKDAICEIDLSVKLEKVESARHAVLDEIEDALHSGRSHPQDVELRAALRVLDCISGRSRPNEISRQS
jgi:hypothetical protein